jgi:hypothetical protein
VSEARKTKKSLPSPSQEAPLAPPSDKDARRRLHTAYRDGNLRVVVGAGVSLTSGFPLWRNLNVQLLHAVLSEQSPALEPLLRYERTAEEVVDALTGSAAADYARRSFGNGADGVDRFKRMLARTLYSHILEDGVVPGRWPTKMVIRSAQRQLAALALHWSHPCPLLYTTNYDPILELALVDMDGRHKNSGPSWARRISYLGKNIEPGKRQGDFVVHLHGYLGAKGDSKGSLIFTERHYLNCMGRDPFKLHLADIRPSSVAWTAHVDRPWSPGRRIVALRLSCGPLQRLRWILRSSRPLHASAGQRGH